MEDTDLALALAMALAMVLAMALAMAMVLDTPLDTAMDPEATTTSDLPSLATDMLPFLTDTLPMVDTPVMPVKATVTVLPMAMDKVFPLMAMVLMPLLPTAMLVMDTTSDPLRLSPATDMLLDLWLWRLCRSQTLWILQPCFREELRISFLPKRRILPSLSDTGSDHCVAATI
ncbi:Hypothetical protein FKW44_023483 [Caligus rogercresseyi]|uniref:Uncharacterized protein n=1 Tax=Caligus rogercresseyi TaxID=217165 RepID=A0A7T8JVF1_CALRO|nr:Hypothetical protein FKW44_023483 [Caligus rogercresseyi]